MEARRRVVAVTVVVLCAVFMFSPPRPPTRYDTDQYLYQDMVRRMKAGAGYYDAADDAVRAVGGSIETARGYRPPTAFLFWRVIPEDGLWPAYVVLVVGATAAVLFLGGAPAFGILLATLYLLILGRFSVEYLFVELWAVPLVAGAFVAPRRERWWLAAGLGLAATSVRELAALVLIGGLLHALVHRRRWLPWAAALAAAAALYAVHAALLASHLDTQGTEAKLLGTGSLRSVVEMMAFQLPAPWFVGPALWTGAVLYLRRSKRLALAGPYAALPWLGLLVDRPYWGAMVVPFLILWAEALGEKLVNIRS